MVHARRVPNGAFSCRRRRFTNGALTLHAMQERRLHVRAGTELQGIACYGERRGLTEEPVLTAQGGGDAGCRRGGGGYGRVEAVRRCVFYVFTCVSCGDVVKIHGHGSSRSR